MGKNLIFSEGRNILIFSLATVGFSFILHMLLKNNYYTLSFIALLIFIVGIIFIFFTIYFFRNPNRYILYQEDDPILICPADGRIVDISEGNFEGYNKKISIFLSPFNVHVNWVPMDGKILDIKYKEGQFVAAYVPKSSLLNERNDIIIEHKDHGKILVRQIAGRVARRIICWIKKGDEVKSGQKYGMIKFSSRVDVFLPENVTLEIKLYQRVTGGKTILGRWK